MREKKRLSDDMMEFIISQLKFKKADGPLLETFTKATVSFSNHTSPILLYNSKIFRIGLVALKARLVNGCELLIRIPLP